MCGGDVDLTSGRAGVAGHAPIDAAFIGTRGKRGVDAAKSLGERPGKLFHHEPRPIVPAGELVHRQPQVTGFVDEIPLEMHVRHATRLALLPYPR